MLQDQILFFNESVSIHYGKHQTVILLNVRAEILANWTQKAESGIQILGDASEM